MNFMMQLGKWVRNGAMWPLICALPWLACGLAAQPTLPAGFTNTLVASVGNPTAIAFLPDGRMLVTSQNGVIRILDGTTLLSTPALDLRSRVCSASERGLLGIAVDPGFESNRRIYVFYTHPGNGSCGGGSLAGPWNRVSRFTFANNTTINPASELVLLDGIWSYGGNHNAGDLAIGGDGMLYVSTGDGGTDYGGSGSGGANDAARERHHLLGKILRIGLDGSVAGGNPFTGPGTGRCNTGPLAEGQVCREIFAWGLRNPFRIAFNPNSGNSEFFINDVGQNTWEEIDVGQAGADYGWNVREGFCANGSTSACPPSNPTPPGMTAPVFAYWHGAAIPGTQTSGCNSITGGAFVPNGAWPAEYDDSYLFADYVCGAIFVLRRNGNTVTVADFARNLGGSSAVHLRFGPYASGQALYYTTYANGGQIRRISAATTVNQPPTAVISATPLNGPIPLQVTFSAAGSGDPNAGDTLTYFWNFGDGSTPQTTTGTTIQHTYAVTGIYTVTLRARDSKGADSATVSLQIAAGNQAPTVLMIAPSAGSTYAVGSTVTLTGQAFDPEQGALPPGAMAWHVILHHGGHTHPYLGPLTGNDLTFSAPAPEDLQAASNSFLEIVLEATDAQGIVTRFSRNIQPRKVNLTFQTEPPGLQLLVNNESISGGSTVVSWEGFVLSVSAPSQTVAGASYAFSEWLDGGAQNRVIVTPPASAAYTARYLDSGAGEGLATVNAASFLAGPLARGSIASGFGSGFAALPENAATLPLPSQMQGISMRLVDGAGVTHTLPLFFVSPAQINFLVPDAVSPGAARLEVLRDATAIAAQNVTVVHSGPALFTANQNGRGVPAAEVLRVAPDGTRTVSPAFLCNGVPVVCAPAPVNLGNPGDTNYLILYATGIRNHAASQPLRVLIQGREAEIDYAGAQPEFLGLDQVNVMIPYSLKGMGNATLQLMVGGVAANPVELRFE